MIIGSKIRYVALFIAFIMLPCHAHANKKGLRGVIKALGKKTYDENVLKPEELKQCLALEKSMEGATGALKEANKRMVDEQNQIMKEEKDILTKKKDLNMKDRDEVNDFNNLITSHNKRRDEYKSGVTKYNKLAGEQRAMAKRYNDDCASKGYYEDDFKAAQKAMKAK